MKKIGLLGGFNQKLMMTYFEEINDKVKSKSENKQSLKSIMVTWDKESYSINLNSRNKVRLIKELIYECDQLRQMGAQVIGFTDPIVNRYIPEINKHISVNLISKELVLGKEMLKYRINKVLFISDLDTTVDPYYMDAYSRYGVTLLTPPLKWVNKMRLDQKKIINQTLSIEDFQLGIIGLIESYALKGITGVIIEGRDLEEKIDASLLSVHVFKSTSLHMEALYKAVSADYKI